MSIGDRTPLLIVKIGRYPLHHGAVAAARSLGRLGVPVYAVTERRFVPIGLSRYVSGRFVWPTNGSEPADVLVAGLRGIGSRLGRPAVALATDDEAAVLLAAHGAELSDLFLMPPVEAGLPGRLADKQALYALCVEHGVPAPGTVTVDSSAALCEAVDRIGLPAVLKNPAPWERLVAPVVVGTTVLRERAELAEVEQALERVPGARVLVQEYLPSSEGAPGDAADWFAHVYCPSGAGEPLVFTGIKVRSWPPGGGVTTRGISVANPQLAAMTAQFCRAIGYRGIGDLDWRRDVRDGVLKLVDFNPRAGAQFQLFRTTAGLDVVRAMYFDVTGREAPRGAQVDGRALMVEHLDAAAAVEARLRGRSSPAVPAPTRRETAWFAWDDPLPFVAATVSFCGAAFARVFTRAAGVVRAIRTRAPERR